MANQLSRLPDRVVTDYSLDTIRPHTFEVALHFLHKYPVFFPWGEGASGDHKAGKALDFPTYAFGEGVNKPGPLRPVMGELIANELWDFRKTFDTHYVIYRQHIISIRNNDYGPAGRWNKMEDRGNFTKNHMDHVHWSAQEIAPFDFKYQEDDMPTAEEVAKAIWDYKLTDKHGNSYRAQDWFLGMSGRIDKANGSLDKLLEEFKEEETQ